MPHAPQRGPRGSVGESTGPISLGGRACPGRWFRGRTNGPISLRGRVCPIRMVPCENQRDRFHCPRGSLRRARSPAEPIASVWATIGPSPRPMRRKAVSLAPCGNQPTGRAGSVLDAVRPIGPGWAIHVRRHNPQRRPLSSVTCQGHRRPLLLTVPVARAASHAHPTTTDRPTIASSAARSVIPAQVAPERARGPRSSRRQSRQ